MNKKKVTGKEYIGKYRVVVGVLLLVFAIAFGLFVLPQAFTSQTTYYTVYAVTKNAYAGETITADMVSLVQTTDIRVAENACTEVDSVMNAVLASDVYKGQYLLKANIGTANMGGNENPSDNVYRDKVPSGKQLMSVAIPSLSASVSYQISTNDIIRFYSIHVDGENRGRAYTPAELQYVEIYGVYDGAGIETAISGGAPSSLALIVTQAQAEKIVELSRMSGTYFSLMSSGDEARAKTFLQYQEKVLEEMKTAQEKPLQEQMEQINNEDSADSNN